MTSPVVMMITLFVVPAVLLAAGARRTGGNAYVWTACYLVTPILALAAAVAIEPTPALWLLALDTAGNPISFVSPLLTLLAYGIRHLRLRRARTAGVRP